VALGLLLVHGAASRAPQEGVGEVVRFEVPRGEPFNLTIARLEDDGLVESSWPVRWYAWFHRLERKIQSGTYEFTVGERPDGILGRLVSGDILKISVTVPEGYTIWEIAGAFASAGVDSIALLEAIADPSPLRATGTEAVSMEGYLFPDTYNVPWEILPSDVVTTMTQRFDTVFDQEMNARAAQLSRSVHQIVTLASIIEAETQVPQERPVVSAVYNNRLQRGMRLEADPTVAYAMGGFKGRLLYADLEIDSPFNTYKNKGLPPGPICSPGRASIMAALYPDTVTTAIYFVARGDGSHIFSHTLNEHLAAVRRVRSGQAQSGGGSKSTVQESNGR